MDRKRFEDLVVEAIIELPREFQDKLENIDVVIADNPTAEQLAEMEINHGTVLLGLYEGVPLTRRGRNYGMVPPDKITIFQRTIEAQCRGRKEIIREVQKVVRHEIAHYFGMDEASLERIEGEM